MSRITRKTVALARIKQAADWLMAAALIVQKDKIARRELHGALHHLGRLARRWEFGSVKARRP